MIGLETPTRALAIGTVAAAVIVVCTFKLMAPERDPPAPELTRTAEVKRAISGHTIKIEPGERLNYAGIRAPYRREPLGDAAFKRNRELVEGQKIRMRFDEQQTDKQGRWVAYVFVDGEMVNKHLVEEGLAYVRLRAGEKRYAEELRAAQNEARNAHRGIWKTPIESTEDQYPGDRKHGAFHWPGCADVTSINPGNEIVFTTKEEALGAGFAPCAHCIP